VGSHAHIGTGQEISEPALQEQRFLRHPILPDVAIGPCRAWHCGQAYAKHASESPGAQTSDWLRTRPGLGVFQTAGVARVLLWPGNLVAQVPGENIRIVGVLEAPTGREQQVIVFIEVIDGADVEPRAVISISAIGGLM
jgi:hypothetical protein